jgi:hypothetical protein
MENSLVSLLCGITAYGVVMYGFFKALKRADRIEAFIRVKLKLPQLASQLWWLFPVLFLFVVVKLVQDIVTFIDPSITF